MESTYCGYFDWVDQQNVDLKSVDVLTVDLKL